MKLTVIVPAYNESRGIRGNLLLIKRGLAKKLSSYEIIVVDDGSTDNTKAEAKKAAAKSKRIKVTGYEENEGKGYALKYGAQNARGDYIAFLDADLEIGVQSIFRLMEEIARGADIAIFSKNHKLSDINFPFYRRLLSRFYYVFAKMLFRLPASDTQTGCKLFRKEVLDEVLPYVYTKQFAFDLELMAYANDLGYRISECPIKIKFAREKGRIKASAIWRMMLDTIIIFFRFHVKRMHKRIA